MVVSRSTKVQSHVVYEIKTGCVGDGHLDWGQLFDRNVLSRLEMASLKALAKLKEICELKF